MFDLLLSDEPFGYSDYIADNITDMKTKIKGLYYCSSGNTLEHGLKLVENLLGYGTKLDKFRGRTLIKDLENLDE